MENLVTEVQVEAAAGFVDSGVGSFSTFQRRIEFHPARKPFAGFSNVGDNGDFKLETLNPRSSDHKKLGSGQGPSGQSGKKVDGSEFWDNGLDPELSFGITFRRIGAGLENLGNTCFLNSVLQCLTYTEPLAAYLQSGKHQNSCRIAGFCALCAIQKHVSRALQATGRILAPKDLVLNLRCISRNFRISRQEDAHEYMVNLLESMHKCCLPSGVPSESPSAYEKSLVHKIFGGRLRSQVKCMQCSHCSNKFDPFLDLSLEIAKADSVHKALINFTAAELLDGGEKQYQCQRCKQKVRALKQLTVHKAPYVLTVHLKRFRSHDPGQKIDKKVQFGPTLDMKPFVSGSYEGDLKYTLYGVLVHHGWSTHSGHYYCFVRTSSGMWYSLDDNRVVQVNERSVLEQKAYMLFYVRDRRDIAPKKPIDVVQKENLKASGNKPCSIISQQLKEHPQNSRIENGICRVDPSGAIRQKDAVNGGLSKEDHLKEASIQPGRLLAQSSVPKKDPLVEPSPSASLVKSPSSVLNLGEGKRLQPSASSTSSNGDMPNSEKKIITNAASINNSKVKASSKNDLAVSMTILPNSKEHQTSENIKLIKDETSQKSNVISNCGTSSITPSRDSSDKMLERVSNMAQSVKILEKMDPIKSPKERSCENNQVGDDPNNCKVDENGQRMGHQVVELSASQAMTNEPLHARALDCAPQRKLKKKKLLKCRTKPMHIGLKFFRASLGLRKKKKQKKSKRRTLDLQNLSKELLLGKDSFSSDLGPSKSKQFFANSTSPPHSGKKAAKGTSKKKNRMCNGDSLVNGVDGELGERIYQNGAVLATEEQSQKHSNSILEANQQNVIEPDSSIDTKKDVPRGGISTLTRGLEPTLVRWDGIELHSQSVESNDAKSFNIGYVLDEWGEEYDRGKRKKLRHHKHDFGGLNPFQEIATKKTQFKKVKMNNHTSSGDRPFRIL